MWKSFWRMFGFYNEAPAISTLPVTPQENAVTKEYVEAVLDTASLERNLKIADEKRKFNPKRYYRRNKKFYKHGVDFDDDNEIIDLILLELLLSAYDDGNIEDWEEPAQEAEIVDNILDVDIDTIPVVDTVSMTDDSAYVEMKKSTPDYDLSYREPEPTYSEPEPSYSEPERVTSTPSYSSGSSDYSSSGSSSYDSGSSSSCDSSCD